MDPAARAGVKNVILFYFILFLVEFILLCTQNDNHLENYLAKSGYKKNMKVNFFCFLFFFLTTLIEPCIRNLANFLIMAIENLKKHLIFSTFSF